MGTEGKKVNHGKEGGNISRGKEEKLRITWHGTACFSIEYGADRILFDPFLELAGGSYAADFDTLMEYDTVFVTHGHFDHLYTAELMLEEGDGDVSVFCTKQCCEILDRFLEDQSNVVQIDAGRTYEIGSIRIEVLKGHHIEFRKRNIFDTLTPWRMLRYAGNLPFLFWANRIFQEGGESVAFLIMAGGKKILLLGSLSVHPQETYPEDVDILILPYQGNNDLPARAKEVLARIRPKSVLLSHFDNAFPPMSRNVNLRPLKRMMDETYPGIRVVKPESGKTIDF